MSIERVPYRAGCVLILQSHADATWDVTIEKDGEPVGAPHARWQSREEAIQGATRLADAIIASRSSGDCHHEEKNRNDLDQHWITQGKQRNMAVVLPVFQKFPAEGEIIGRLVVGYGELEIDLCRCVAKAVDDLDTVVRKMFGRRGETLRINTAVCIGRGIYESLGLGELFDEIICGMRYCLKIRNQFAHGNFYDDNTGALVVVDVEELAKQNVVIEDLTSLTVKHLTQDLLKKQEYYFLYIRVCLDFLKCEGQVRAGTLAKNPFAVPEKVNLPPTHIA